MTIDISALGMSALTTLIGAGIGGAIVFFKIGVKRLAIYDKVIKALTHDALFGRCNEILAKGELTTESLENLDTIFECYTGLGMNGSGEKLYNDCMKLPVKIDE